MEIQPERPSPLLRLLFLIPIILLGFYALAARLLPKPAHSQHPVNMAMPVVRTYGLGLSRPTFVRHVVSPEEAWRYRDDIRALFLAEKFADLENIAQANRDDPTFLPGGVWKSDQFYEAMNPASYHPLTDADYQSYIEKAKRWQAAFPESSAARISLAEIYLRFANFGRGTAYADSVSDAQWQAFNERTATAQQVLLDAAQLREHDPAWFDAMLYLALDAGWSNQDTRELFDQAIAIQPTNYHFYRSYAHYLLPQWYGSQGDIQRLAEEAAAKNPEPAGSILYFQTMGEVACYCQTLSEQLSPADWSKLKLGYANLIETYGPSNYVANQYAAMSAVFCDKKAGREAFKDISFRDTTVWGDDKSFNYIRDWTTAPDAD
jgi:Domain of unknown function (DUF4034)